MNEWVPGYRASNRAYLHDFRQLSEGPTRNRQNYDVIRVLRHRERATLRRAARGFSREANLVPESIPNLLPSGFHGVYWASWGALIRPASDKSGTQLKDLRGNQPFGRVVRH